MNDYLHDQKANDLNKEEKKRRRRTRLKDMMMMVTRNPNSGPKRERKLIKVF